MAKVVLDDGNVVVGLGRWERLLALRREDVVIPIDNIVGVRRVDLARRHAGFSDPTQRLRGQRFVYKKGSFLGNGVLLGSFRRPGGPATFIATYGDDPGYLVETTGDPYELIIVSTDSVLPVDDLVGDDAWKP